jgi:hypothetical protein
VKFPKHVPVTLIVEFAAALPIADWRLSPASQSTWRVVAPAGVGVVDSVAVISPTTVRADHLRSAHAGKAGERRRLRARSPLRAVVLMRAGCYPNGVRQARGEWALEPESVATSAGSGRQGSR